MNSNTEVKKFETKTFDQKFYQKFGKRILDILESNKEINSSMRELEKICDKYNYIEGNWEKDMVLEWAYAGVVLSSLSGFEDAEHRLNLYVKNIRKTLEHNKYDDPAFYVQEIFNSVFK